MEEFEKQVNLHKKKIKKLFGVVPKVFANTELAYTNSLAAWAESKKYKGIIAEGWDPVLGWRSPNYVYRPTGTSKISLLLKNYKLSDDIAFRFSERSWEDWPLTVPKYTEWISAHNGNGQVINLFMDYETFGEHQWKETGIFEFLEKLPEELLKNPDNSFMTPSEVIKNFEPVGDIDVPHVMTWADTDRDLTAWVGNKMQQDAIQAIYALEKDILKSKDEKLISDWRHMLTSDHFYYMCTKWFADGDVPVSYTHLFTLDVKGNDEYTLYYWMCLAKDIQEAKDLNIYVLEKTPQYLIETTQDYWKAWVNKQNFNFHTLDERLVT